MSQLERLAALTSMVSPRLLVACALFAATGCGGSSIVLQSEDASASDASVDGVAKDSGADAAAPCGPKTCQGCCRSDGTCNMSTSAAACGAEGSACVACNAGESCNKPAAGCNVQLSACTPQNCDGCCVLFPPPTFQFCAHGTFGAACGHGGQACEICGGGGTCSASGGGGSCQGQPPCSTSTCSGCCFGNVCAFGVQDLACGGGGESCKDCTAQGLTCKTGACGK